MNNGILPTKSNLMKVRKTLHLSTQGQVLLEKKKVILLKEKEKYETAFHQRKSQMDTLWKEAYTLLQQVNVDMGIEMVESIATGIPEENSIDLKYKTFMGVDIPSLVWDHTISPSSLDYSFYQTTMSLDKAVIKWKEVKENLISLTELTHIIDRLQRSIDKVATRSNALKNIMIPEHQALAKQMQEALEERDREEFARLKTIKKRMASK